MRLTELFESAPRGEVFVWGPFEFDIDAALKMAAKKSEKDVLPVADMVHMKGFMRVDPEYSKTTDLTKPILIGTLLFQGQLGYLPIDGWHRITKAHNEGVKELPVNILDFNQTMKIMSCNGPAKRKMLKAYRELNTSET